MRDALDAATSAVLSATDAETGLAGVVAALAQVLLKAGVTALTLVVGAEVHESRPDSAGDVISSVQVLGGTPIPSALDRAVRLGAVVVDGEVVAVGLRRVRGGAALALETPEAARIATLPGLATLSDALAVVVRCQIAESHRGAATNAEAPMSDRDRRFQWMFDQAALGVSLMGEDGRFLRVNRKLCDILGYEEEELRSARYQAFSPEAAATDAEAHRRLVDGSLGQTVIEKKVYRKAGEAAWVRVAISRILEPGQPTTFLAVTEDITSQRVAEARLAESEERLRILVEHAPAAIALLDAEMRLLCVSNRYLADCGVTDKEVIGRSYYDVFPTQPRSWSAIHERCLDGAIERSDGELVVRADGVVDWVRWEMRPWRSAAGATGGLVLFSELITEQRRTAESLAQSERRYRAIFEHAGVGIASIDPQTGCFLEVNEQLVSVLGYSRAELARMTWEDVTHPDDVAEHRASLVEAFEVLNLTSLTREKRYVRKDGAIRWGKVTVTMVGPDEDGRRAYVKMIADETERRSMLDALRESEKRLALVLEASLTGMLIQRASDGRIVDVSASITHLIGYSRRELLGLPLGEVDIFADDESAAVLANELGASIGSQEVRLKRKAGDVGHFVVRTCPLTVAGEPCRVVALNDVTELHRRAESLAQSERELRALFELAPVGLAEQDLVTGRLRRANGRLAAITGYPVEELCGLDPVALDHPDDRQATNAGLEQLRSGELEELRQEKRLIRRGGGVAWVRLTMTASERQAGQATRALAIVDDITERRAAESSLRIFASALRASANAIVITDRAGRIESINPAFTTLTGYEEAEVIGKSPRLLKSGKQSAESYRDLWTTVTRGEVWRGEIVNRRKDGSLYHEDMTITPLRDAGGTISHFIAIKQDITKRHQGDEALRESEERYRDLVDSLEDVVYSTDDQQRITFVSQACRRFGYEPEDLIGKRALDVVHPDDLEVAASRLSGQRPEEAGAEVRVVDAKGRVRFARFTHKVRFTGGVFRGTTGLLIDETARRETEEQLRAAQKMEAIGRLAAGVAHDFNNLLSVIISYSELAVADLRPEDPLRADLQEVVGAAQRGAALTRQLLAFSRKQMLNPEPLDLNEVVSALDKMLHRMIGEDIELVIATDPRLALVRADRGQLEQVVMNLVVNARDAMPEGGAIRIATSNVELEPTKASQLEVGPGSYVELLISDNGCGMDDVVLARIFEPFFTTKGVGKGTGLGLSMVFGIIRQSEGGIEVTSELGRGTVFKIYLPKRPGDPRQPKLHTDSTRPRQGHEVILVIEDEPALRNVIRRVLVASGYQVWVAANAGEALLLCEKNGRSVRLILTDVVMPGMRGPELVVRLAPLCPTAKVIFMSGHADEAIERHGMSDADFLRKPFDWKSLTHRVREMLDQLPG